MKSMSMSASVFLLPLLLALPTVCAAFSPWTNPNPTLMEDHPNPQSITSRSASCTANARFILPNTILHRSFALQAFGVNSDFENEEEEGEDVEEEFDVETFLEERRRKKESGDADEEEQSKNLTGEFFKNLRIRNIGRNTRLGRTRRNPQLFNSDVRGNFKSDEENSNDDQNEIDDSDDENVREFTASEMNIFKGIDEGGVGKLAGNVTITNKDLYASLKERVLESPSAFQKLTTAANDEDDDFSELSTTENVDDKSYTPPETVPDAELTAGEVVTTVLEALRHNDVPTMNKGIEILFAYSSSANILADPLRAPTVDEYSDMLKSSSDSKILLNHREVIFDKADYSQDRKRAFITVRLKDAEGTWTGVNFILSIRTDDQCWLIDSHLVKVRGLRRGRRW